MIIKKDTKILVNHKRKGMFYGIVIEDFDTEKRDFYPIALNQDELYSFNNDYVKGDIIPCRRTLCEIKIIKQAGDKNES